MQEKDGEQKHWWEQRGSKTRTHVGHYPHLNAKVQKDINTERVDR